MDYTEIGRILEAAILLVFIFLTADCYSNAIELTKRFGDSSSMKCDPPFPADVAWFKDGQKINETRRIKPFGADNTLHIFCLDPSDNGIYQCMAGSTVVTSFNLTVVNPENRAYFRIHSKDHGKCVSSFGPHLLLSPCNLDDCQQKWSWTISRRLMSANAQTQCITARQGISGGDVVLERCSLNNTLQQWECKENDLLSIKGLDLYLNYNNTDDDFILFSGTGVWSRWVKYSSGHSLCVNKRKAIVYPAHVILSHRQTTVVTCKGINFVSPSYKWHKNGKHVQLSGLGLHVDFDKLVVPFAYATTAGNYTCVVNDTWGTAEATTVIEVFQDPSVIRHSLNETVRLGKDVCFSCQMYVNASYFKINWYKDGTPIQGDHPKFNITKIEKGKFKKKLWTHLCIQSVQLGDEGDFTCEIKCANQSASAVGKLQILVSPTVYIRKLGDELVCNASGFPPPRLIWYKDGKSMEEYKNDGNSLLVKEAGGNYTCFASSSVGTDSRSYISVVPVASNAESDKLSLGLIIGGALGVIVFIILLILVICCCCRRKKTVLNNNDDSVYHTVRYTAAPGEYATPVESPTRVEFQPRCSTDPGPKHVCLEDKVYSSMKPQRNAEWEVPPECLKLDEKLGEGQFGQVWKGQILSRKGTRPVAVKMLRENAPNKDRKALIDELEFMKTMNPHPNIVGLVGCCSRSDELMIIVEYVPHGNLKEFLLRSRGQTKDTYANLAPYSRSLTSNDLMLFAYQIARGMSFLEKIKCVHRDLAARNILVGDEKTCKIADFGLARDIYCENYYRKTNGGRLPLRWMAYESIFNGITTSQSDSWSFGVLLWEIVTLGGNPYPEMSRDQLIDALQRGYRMPKPHHCSNEVYSIMWECWQQNPDKRPTFAELTASFLRLVSLQQIWIDMQTFGEEDYVNVGSYELQDE